MAPLTGPVESDSLTAVNHLPLSLRLTDESRQPARVKQVRFASLVEAAGRPTVYTPWQDPKQDPAFRAALRRNRVVTIDRVNVGAKKDAAEVGFFERDNALYLLFPKSLAAFRGKRIVGLNYDLLEQAPASARPRTIHAPKPAKIARVRSTLQKPLPRTSSPLAKPPAPAPKPPSEPPAPPPPPPRFRVAVLCRATVTIEREVEAKNRSQARRAALRALEGTAIDFSGAKVEKRAVKVKAIKPAS